MYITKHYSKIPSGKKYRSVLLRKSYRENGKVKNRTLANLKNLPDKVIDAIEMALKQKENLAALQIAQLPGIQIVQGKSEGKLCSQEVHITGREPEVYIPTPVNREQQLLECIGVTLPKTPKK